MERTITVKGTGRVSLPPDLTVVTMTLKSLDKDYDAAMAAASARLGALETALAAEGFAKEALKTVSFNVCTEQEGVQDERGNYRTVFAGYACYQALKLEFDFDTARLSRVLSAVSGSAAEAELNVRFTVRDTEAVNRELLESAARNARAKAEILTAASGAALGELVRIDYHWDELNVFSRTDFAAEKRCMAMGCNAEMTPENVEVSDNATFTWELA